jgi:RNA-binding protein Nova
VGAPAEQKEEQANKNMVKLVVPSAVCGGIIGKTGSTIRSYVEDSGAHIKLSSQETMVPGVHERVITITGSIEEEMRAVALIITKMAEDPNFPMHSSINLSYPQAGGMPASPMHGSFAGGIALAPSVQAPPLAVSPMHSGGPTTAVTVAVPDEHIGAVVGTGGKYISEMQQVSGVRIKISDRTDYVPGTRNRKVTLTGTLEAVQIAQFLISQKVQQSAADMQSNPPHQR